MRQALGHCVAFGLPVLAGLMSNETFADRMNGGQGMGTVFALAFGMLCAFGSVIAVATAIVVHGPVAAHSGRIARRLIAMVCAALAALAYGWLHMMWVSPGGHGEPLSYQEEEPAFLAATLIGLGLTWAFYLIATSRPPSKV